MQAVPEQPLGARHKVGMLSKDWHWLKEKGVDLNPCNSPLHPAVLAGAIEVAQGQTMASIQEACGFRIALKSTACQRSLDRRPLRRHPTQHLLWLR